jgi:peptide deformylase
VERPEKVRIRATDLEGNVFEEEYSGLEGRCILHENDHINGVLFIDRMRGKDRQKIESMLREVKKKFYKKPTP